MQRISIACRLLASRHLSSPVPSPFPISVSMGVLSAEMPPTEIRSYPRPTMIILPAKNIFSAPLEVLIRKLERAASLADREYITKTELRSQCQVLNAHVAHIESELNAGGNELERMKIELDSAQQHLATLQNMFDSTKSERDELLRTLVATRRQYSGLTDMYIDRDYSIPGIIFNTMPKSGSIYIAKTLAASLGIEFREISLSYGFFPNYFIYADELKRINQGNVIRQEHFDASEINLHLLSKYANKLVVHVRDPRQATLSWLHHFNRLAAISKNIPYAVNYTIHIAPDGYLDWSFSEQLDWHIHTHLRSLAEWINGWVTCANSTGDVEILFTRFEDLVADENLFMKGILQFYSIPISAFNYSPASKDISNNYRNGEVNEWRDLFNGNQKDLCCRILGDNLLNKFQWA